MKAGDLARSSLGWLLRLLGKSTHGWHGRWETGPLQGREANVTDSLRRVG